MEYSVRGPSIRFSRRPNWFAGFLCFALFLPQYMRGLQAATIPAGDCDPGLRLPEENSPNSYVQRTGRCEGIYAKEIAAVNLSVASFAMHLEKLDPKGSGAVRLDWSSPTNNPIRLRAVSLRPRFFYRMDAFRPSGTTSWMWPTDLLNALDLDKASLGITATTIITLNGIDRVLYLPIRVSTQAPGQSSGPYQILLHSDVELSEVYVSIAELSKDGKPVKALWQDKPLQYGIYPAERGIPIWIGPSELLAKTIYQVDIGATLRTGGSANARLWLYSGL
jgi:hypothetical protein